MLRMKCTWYSRVRLKEVKVKFQEITKVAVIGSGVMGGGIAAQVANAGFPVVLLDVVPKGSANRNVVAEEAIARLLKTGAFMHRDFAKLVSVGNIEDDLGMLSDCDWICEVVVENLAVKRELFKRIDAVRKSDSIVSSNTSTIPLSELIAEQSDAFARDFVVTHFFNPPRHMRLLELVKGGRTRQEAVQAIELFCDLHLGKFIVHCKDTPGFIANRIGIYWMQTGVVEAIKCGVSIEEADAVMSRPVGIPKTGIFGLWDLVGIDLSPRIISSMLGNLPTGDPYESLADIPVLIREMIESGYTGRKGKGGFYRVRKLDGNKLSEVKDLRNGGYRALEPVILECLNKSSLRDVLTSEDRGGRYLWSVLSHLLAYTASLVPEICDDIVGVDDAMRMGYAWAEGPFELLDRIGASWFAERLRLEGRKVPKLIEQVGQESFYRVRSGQREYLGSDGKYHPVLCKQGVIRLADIKLRSAPVACNESASLWDIGDGVACLEFHTKMNSMSLGVLAMIDESCRIVADRFTGLVLYNDGRAFSAGADLATVRSLLLQKQFDDLEIFLESGQRTYQRMKLAPFPVVGAVSGLAFGGGCEVLLHCDAIRPHAEANMGLVEIGVGLIPGWGGCKELLIRWQQRLNDPQAAARKAFSTIFGAAVSSSADEARELGFIDPDAPITMNRDRLLSDAKADVLALAKSYHSPEPKRIKVAGEVVRKELADFARESVINGNSAPYDASVGVALAGILTGGDGEYIDEDEIFSREREYFNFLIQNSETLARIEHMLKTGKPLRN